jgi:hypothetical protein
MNANELADELEYACTIAEPRIEMMKRMKLCATMLRQQQSEIDTYKLQNNNQIDTYRHKNLTDGEILDIYLNLTNGNKDLDILEFAEMILKKNKK